MSTSSPAFFGPFYTPPTDTPVREQRPVRTYSHKRQNITSAGPLPQLKPEPVHGPTRRKLPRQSPEPESEADGESSTSSRPSEATGDEEDEQRDDYYPYEVEYAEDTDDDERDQETQSGSSMPSRKSRRTTSSVRFRDEYEPEDSENDAPKQTSSDRTSITDYSVRHNSPAPALSFATSVRRRPFLVFNKHPTKTATYKKLDRKKTDPTKKKAAANYIPGDGFSDSEARPNGLFQLTKKRKLHYSVPAVGSLDLTNAPATSVTKQTSTASASTQPKEPRIIFKRKKRVRDNSFLPPPPKKARRERENPRDKGKGKEKEKPTQKQPKETQITAASGISAPYGQMMSSVILGEMAVPERIASLTQIIEEEIFGPGKDNEALFDKEQEISLPVSDHSPEQICHDQIEKVQVERAGKQQRELVVPFSDFVVEETQYSRSQSLPPGELIQEETEGSPSSRRTFRRVKTN